MKYEILDNISSPADVKALDAEKIPALCEEIRAFLIDNVERSGGHLGSNLGATELSVAIHRVFDSPKDHIIFDVGHQSYVHKILTGRKDAFDTLRTTGGLSGFTKMSESEHDAFGAGHSSTSISAALGFAEADRLNGSDAYTVAVLGDGAYTGGMVHEALNNCDPDLKLIIILNENGMSISLNKGTFASYLSRVRISNGYQSWKRGTNSFISRIPLIGKPLKRFITFVKNKIKGLFFASNYFEDLGLYYTGPIDGNDAKKVEKALTRAKKLGRCVIVHLKTAKGKGYAPAESAPDNFHSVYSGTASQESFHAKMADKLISLAAEDEKIVAITAAMGIGTGLDKFEEQYPKRYFDVGIAEAHALTFSAGLAASGLKPFTAIYSTFMQRGYDSVLHDIALQRLPVKMMIDRAGLAVGDGATHHGIFDVSFLSHIPEITVISPITYSSLEAAVEYAATADTPIAVRYPNSKESPDVVAAFYSDSADKSIGAKIDFAPEAAPEKVFITYGGLVTRVLKAEALVRSRTDKTVGTVLLEMLRPYDKVAESILPYLKNATHIVFAEEGIKNGGAAMLLRDALERLGFDFTACKYEIAAIDDNFASPDEPCELYDYLGLSPEKLAEKMD
ncbi:MAG: 1-deoxy-D-xylulose-5-phosphate synthase [Clostridia bacterium]|nr:1-deoxy-D-xylulose-5-phosphate synthase [Clostridia bacterium]